MMASAQFLFINSADRLQGDSSSDFLVDIQDMDIAVSGTGLTIQNLIMPNVYYNMNSNNNFINLGATNMTIPPANYTASQFTSYFNSNNPLGISMSLNTQTGLPLYTHTGSFTIAPTAKQKYLGLSAGTYLGTTSIFGNRVADFSGSNFFDILIDGISLFSTNTRNYNKNILIRIYNNVDFGNYMNYTLTKLYTNKTFEQTSYKQPIRLSVLDENGDAYQMLNAEWQMTILFIAQQS